MHPPVLFLFYIVLFVCVHAQPNGNGGGMASSTNYLDLSGVYTITNQTVTNSNQVVISTISNQSCIVITGVNAFVPLVNLTVNKTGDTTSGNDSNFYGSLLRKVLIVLD